MFYEMLSNIKTCQLETASQCSSSVKTLLLLRLTGHLFTKRSLSVLTSSCHVCFYSHKMLWLY